MHRCIVCLGSNHNRTASMALARQQLAQLYPSIRFATETETQPLFLQNEALFSNQLALFFTPEAEAEVRSQLKRMEQSAGRTSADKEKEIVRLDIDLLVYDHRILKPEDMKRTYVVAGLEELKLNNKDI